MSKFGETERYIKQLFSKCSTFVYEGIQYKVLVCGKPAPSRGECKTDVYVLAEDDNKVKKEFKISVKQSNADFLENKISLSRAIEIMGENAQSIIKENIIAIKRDFLDDYLVYFNSFRRTEAKCIKIGWKFEFLNKQGGERSAKMNLTDRQKIDVYAGSNLGIDKKNCMVNGEIIENSGVANFILNIDNVGMSLDSHLQNMKSIENFAKKQEIYFACKALNYRCEEGKWDGNRPLSVYVNWKLDNNKLEAEIVFDKPLSIKGDEIGQNIQNILSTLNIGHGNFSELSRYLDNTIKIK